MRKRFYKLYESVLASTDDVVSTAILGVILAYYDGGNKPQVQQTHIAQKLRLTRPTVKKHIDDLAKKGYIKATPSSWGNGTTTQFIIMPKLRRLISDVEEQATTPQHQDQTPPPHTPQAIEQDEVNIWEFFSIPSEYKPLNTTAI